MSEYISTNTDFFQLVQQTRMSHDTESDHTSESWWRKVSWGKVLIAVLLLYFVMAGLSAFNGIKTSPWLKNVGTILDQSTSLISWLLGNLWVLPLGYVLVSILPGGLAFIARKMGQVQRDPNADKLSDDAKAAVGNAIASDGLTQRANETHDEKYANQAEQLAGQFDTWKQNADDEEKSNVDDMLQRHGIEEPSSISQRNLRAQIKFQC